MTREEFVTKEVKEKQKKGIDCFIGAYINAYNQISGIYACRIRDKYHLELKNGKFVASI